MAATDDRPYDEVSTVIASRYKLEVVDSLGDTPATPSDIAAETGSDIAHISRALQTLREEDIVDLLVSEERKKGRLYGLTDLGDRVSDTLEDMGKFDRGDN